MYYHYADLPTKTEIVHFKSVPIPYKSEIEHSRLHDLKSRESEDDSAVSEDPSLPQISQEFVVCSRHGRASRMTHPVLLVY